MDISDASALWAAENKKVFSVLSDTNKNYKKYRKSMVRTVP